MNRFMKWLHGPPAMTGWGTLLDFLWYMAVLWGTFGLIWLIFGE